MEIVTIQQGSLETYLLENYSGEVKK